MGTSRTDLMGMTLYGHHHYTLFTGYCGVGYDRIFVAFRHDVLIYKPPLYGSRERFVPFTLGRITYIVRFPSTPFRCLKGIQSSVPIAKLNNVLSQVLSNARVSAESLPW